MRVVASRQIGAIYVPDEIKPFLPPAGHGAGNKHGGERIKALIK